MSDDARRPLSDPKAEARRRRKDNALKYWSECRQYLVIMGQKYTGLLSQASVFSFAACTGVLALAEKLKVGFPKNLVIAAPCSLGLSLYLIIIVRYFHQIRTTGTIMLELETKFLGERLSLKLGLLHALRGSRGAFYGRPSSLAMTWTYGVVLVALPVVTAVCVGALVSTTGQQPGSP